MEVSFVAYEYRSDEIFHKAKYRYQGSIDNGWKIYCNDKLLESLGAGYELLQSLHCGICATDMVRAKLPFSLPQITGHEVVALFSAQPVVVDINASHLARGVSHSCYYCEHLMGAHCPDRLTLGIDRLPGGFSPYLLVPKNAIYPVPESIDPRLAVVIEPFAAALHAVESMTIYEGARVAVVGAGRLGLLLIFALALFRKGARLKFTIHGIVRHSALSNNCLLFGADEVLLTSDLVGKQYDIVYDTSGSVSGFQQAMALANVSVHVKSTHGLPVDGFAQLTRFVIDELSLFPLADGQRDRLQAALSQNRKSYLLLDEKISQATKNWIVMNYTRHTVLQCDLTHITISEMKQLLPKEGFKKFDFALVSSLSNLNKVIFFPGLGNLLRAKGVLFWQGNGFEESALWAAFFKKSLSLYSSRCGDFPRAISMIEQNAKLFSTLITQYITGCFELEQINQAFDQA
ncbi:MAG TPA: hypothetical protein ENK06_11465, partial [Gammaproteobacteria bacterium]|nr:hypothetical protein [Gammaproteobacteria bacterium]